MTVVVLAVAAVAVLVLLRAWASSRWAGQAETFDFRGPLRAIEVTVGDGDVTVRGGAASGARVRRTLRRGLRRPSVEEQVDDGVLRLAVRDAAVRYELDVPHRASVTVSAGSGSTTVIGTSGPVALRSSTGLIEGRALGGDEVRATADTATIRLSFDRAPALVDVEADTATVDLTLPHGPYAVDARMDRGAARIGIPVDDSARRLVRCWVSAGSVRIGPR